MEGRLSNEELARSTQSAEFGALVPLVHPSRMTVESNWVLQV
jgi:hypothetical protein